MLLGSKNKFAKNDNARKFKINKKKFENSQRLF